MKIVFIDFGRSSGVCVSWRDETVDLVTTKNLNA